MIINGQHLPNITCRRCKRRHPVSLACAESKAAADRSRPEQALGYPLKPEEAPESPTMPTLTRLQAESLGYAVDTTCYPWLAYRGFRSAPTESNEVLTDREAELIETLRAIKAHLGSAHFRLHITLKDYPEA